GLHAYRANQPGTALVLQREHKQKVGRVQRAVQLAIHDGAARVDISDVKEMVVRAAWETDPQRLPHGGVRAVATRNVGCLADRRGPIDAPETCAYAAAALLERHELGLALHVHASL